MSKRDKVLVIGDDTRSFLASVRSLGRQGIEVHVAPFNFSSPALASRYIHAKHFLPYYLDGGREWLDAMRSLLRDQCFSLVLPCDERALLPLCLHREELSTFAHLAIPSPHALDVFFDKVKTRALAESVGVPVAPGRMLRQTDTVDSIEADIGLPVVIKEPKSYALPELYVRTSTRIIADRGQLANWLAQYNHTTGTMLLETMFPGFGLGVSVLCHEGKILQAFEHHRANELNGSSYYRKSAPLHPDRLAAVERMVSACGYTGLAMFEFKASPADGKWILIEVNARPWGSLPLPVSLGVDFPYRLYRLSVHNEPTASIDYPVGHYCRNLIQDIWQTRSAASGLIRQPVRLGLHCLGWLWSFHRALLGREHYDTLVLDDPRPGLRELFADRWGSRGRKKGGRPLGGAQLISHLDRLVHERSGRNIEVLFVCQGNINRSSYAELKAKQLFGSSLFRFSSAGMLPRNRRGSPAVAISAAACHGVDMSAHRSRHASAAVLNAADVILVFDEINLKSIAARYPELDKPVYLIGEVISSADPQILDPEGKSEATFFSTYRRIDECLTVLERSVQTHGELMQEGAKC